MPCPWNGDGGTGMEERGMRNEEGGTRKEERGRRNEEQVM